MFTISCARAPRQARPRSLLASPDGVCFPPSAMLDPRALSERRDEILEACRRRGARVDVDAAVAAYEQVARDQTALNQLNRQRNEHQESGKRKLSPDERAAHVAEGRRLKDAVTAQEERLEVARAELEARM